jgi:hypothetical protein
MECMCAHFSNTHLALYNSDGTAPRWHRDNIPGTKTTLVALEFAALVGTANDRESTMLKAHLQSSSVKLGKLCSLRQACTTDCTRFQEA